MLRPPVGGGAPKHPATIGSRSVIANTHAHLPPLETLPIDLLAALIENPQLIRESRSALYMNTPRGDKRNNKIGPLGARRASLRRRPRPPRGGAPAQALADATREKETRA